MGTHREKLNPIRRAAIIFAQIKSIVDRHDDLPPAEGGCKNQQKAQGVQMAWADINDLGWEEGDLVYPQKGLKLAAGGPYGVVRVVCDCTKRQPAEVGGRERVGEGEEVLADSQADERGVTRRRVVREAEPVAA